MDNKAQNSGMNKKKRPGQNNAQYTLKASKKTVKKVTKPEARLKKPSKKMKIKAEVSPEDSEMKNEDSFKTKKLPLLKKRKLKTDCEEEPKKKKANTKAVAFRWTDEEYLAQHENLSPRAAKNIIKLFNNDNTIPFIARYRGDLTGDLKPDKLRKIKATYEYIQVLHTKAEQVLNLVSSNQAVTPDMLEYVKGAQTVEELEFIGSQFKKDSKRSLAERAKQLGLEVPTKELLEGKIISFENLINPSTPGLEDVKNVQLGIQHIIADIISKNPDVHTLLEKIYTSDKVLLTSTFRGVKNENDKAQSKYHLYGDFSQTLNMIRPHQTLAINRGESENELSVKIVIPELLWSPLKDFCKKNWQQFGNQYESLLHASLDDAIKRLLKPLAVRRIRAKLNTEAENEALVSFGSNLRQLLLTRPCSGHAVMGIDPGFDHGCKVAVVTHTGNLITHDIFFLKSPNVAKNKLKSLVFKYGCEVIALGNGKGCRETENFLSDIINEKTFSPYNVSYTIVSEQGISIYSCSSTAEEEFPDLDPKIVSAISLARRLQNPLSELVKVEPKHLGVGMYQHDVGEKKLVSTLDDIVSECVSFVGVDINTASFYLLKRVAGLSKSKAQEIIKYRTEVCSFKTREDLKKVKGIKTVTFQQCAGFIRVVPSTARCAKHFVCERNFNPLDETSIHPESYESAMKIMELFEVDVNQLGSEEFLSMIRQKVKMVPVEELARYSGCSVLSAMFIVDTLTKPKNFDMRSLSPGPIFRREIKKLEEILPGQILEGVVRNVVTFGAFVDIGVGPNGLIHASRMGNSILSLNDKVKVQVISRVLSTQRIELKLLSVIK